MVQYKKGESMTLINDIKQFKPYNQQEKHDKEIILKALIEHDDIFIRANKSFHMTVSGWVTNQKRDKILMIHHNES